MTDETTCPPGFYRNGATNYCDQCSLCSSDAYFNGNLENACTSTELCPRWCSVYNRANYVDEQYDCEEQPAVNLRTSAPKYTSILTTDYSTFGSTTDSTTPVTPDTRSLNPAAIAVPVLVVVLICVLALCCYKKRRVFGAVCSKIRSTVTFKTPSAALKTFMIDTKFWHLEIVTENPESCWRFWLTVSNTDTHIIIQPETEWKSIHERKEIVLPSGGSFCAKLGVNRQINESIKWIHSLNITAPNQPCECSVEKVMDTIGLPDSVYQRLCIDLNCAPESIKKIGHVLERDTYIVESLLNGNKPFAALLENAMTESDIYVAHIIMGLTRGIMTEREQRVVGYLLRWHRNCDMCQIIKAHNTGSASLRTSIRVPETNVPV